MGEHERASERASERANGPTACTDGRYGFVSVNDWHAVADYRGPFRYPFGPGESWAQLDPPDWLFDEGVFAQMRRRIG